MVVEPEPVVVAERVAEVALDRAPVRDRRVRPAGGVVGVLHHDHLAGRTRRVGVRTRQQPRTGEVLGPLRVQRAAVDAELLRTRARWHRPGSGGSTCTRGTRGCRRPPRRPVARPRTARRCRRRRAACRRPSPCRTASDRRRRRVTNRIAAPTITVGAIPSSTTPTGVSPAPPPENISEHAVPGRVAGGGEIGGGHQRGSPWSSPR